MLLGGIIIAALYTFLNIVWIIVIMRKKHLIAPLKLLALSLIVFLLYGCRSAAPQPKNLEVERSVKMVQLSRQLESFGARVIQTGQTLCIILPSDQIFNPHSANFTASATGMLNTTASLMAILETTSAQIAGYTDAERRAAQNVALSARQAQVVANYLWSRGVDARLLYAVGYGVTGQASPGLPGSFKDGANRRIKIQFQYLPLLTSL